MIEHILGMKLGNSIIPGVKEETFGVMGASTSRLVGGDVWFWKLP